MLWIALAAQISAARPVNLSEWFTPDDVPSDMISDPGWADVEFALTVDPTGKIVRCTVFARHGNIKSTKLDAYTCGLIRRRARMAPARMSNGLPTYGVYRSDTVYSVDMRPGTNLQPDVDVTVSNLPPGVQSPVWMTVAFAVDAGGHYSSCGADDPTSDARLVQVACEQVLSGTAVPAATDLNGNPVPSVQSATVRFTKQ